jgi:ubiquinone/menaquinone biosynthesis C-methylase UbiE
LNDLDALVGAIDLHGRTVVDVGCGDGAFVRALAGAGADALGVDIDVTRANEVDPEGRYLEGGAERLPLEDASVDVATLMRSLHHVPDPHEAFPELRRVVRELVYIAEPLPTGDFFELLRPVDDETEVRRVAQEAIAAAEGFERVRTIEYAFTVPLQRFEQFRDRVLGADPSRAEHFAALEPELRARWEPRDYTMPMRADLLRPWTT